MNITDIQLPKETVSRRVMDLVLVLGSSWLIALSAQYSILVPFSPVPITGQTLVVLIAGLVLGKNRAFGAVGLYLLQGIAGMPFFAGGKSGLAALVGPTGGYLIGFLAAAYTVGMLSELRFKKSPWQITITLIIGNILIYLFGLVWLVQYVGEPQVLRLGFYPFLVGDALKIVLGVAFVWGSSHLIKSPQDYSDRS